MDQTPGGSQRNQRQSHDTQTKGAGGNITFLSAYALTADGRQATKKQFYDTMAKTIEEGGNFPYVGGVSNAKLYERQSHEEDIIGQHILKRKGYLAEEICDNTRDNRSRFAEL